MDYLDIYLHEDLGEQGDITSEALFTNQRGKATIVAKDDCIIAGLQEAQTIFHRLGAQTTPLKKDGDICTKGDLVLTITGSIQAIFAGERLALNFIGKMSGIASITRELVEKCRKLNPDVRVAATRKTTPGFRVYEKKAVVIGGGDPHRQGLFDAVLIKDNHIAALGSLEKAIKKAQENTHNVTIEVEVENREDACIAAGTNIDYIMLDNIPPKKGQSIAQEIRNRNPQIKIEVSGGITPATITQYVYADRISLGWLTHSVTNKDFSLEMTTKNIN
jgi:nicotinate-nucleotide pyrophosphorylase (carboxylating)